MRESTWQRLFGSVEEEENAAEEAARQETSKIREFVTREGYRDFRQWLKLSLRQSEVEAGPHEEMLAQIGFRQGLRHIESYLDTLEASVKGN